MFTLGFLDSLLGNLQSGLERADEAVRLAVENEQPRWELLGRLLQVLNAYWRGNYDQAHPIAVEAVATGERHHVTHSRIYNMWAQGLAFGGNGRYKDAIVTLRDTIDLCKRMGDTAIQSRCWNTLGWIHGELWDWDKAIEYNREGLELAHALGDSEISINAQINLADAAFAIGDVSQSMEELEALKASIPQLHDWMKWRYSQHILHSLGDAVLASGDLVRAITLAEECLALAERTDSRKYIVKARRLRGQAWLAQGETEEAERELVNALEVARETSNPPQLWKTHVAYGDLRRAQGKPKEARQCYRDAYAVIENVAAGLDDGILLETFLNSSHVQSIRRAASA